MSVATCRCVNDKGIRCPRFAVDDTSTCLVHMYHEEVKAPPVVPSKDVQCQHGITSFRQQLRCDNQVKRENHTVKNTCQHVSVIGLKMSMDTHIVMKTQDPVNASV